MSNNEISEIIDQLKPVVAESNFTQLLDTMTPDFSKPQRFLLKMELTRLAKPCTRVIDQRGKVHIDTEAYTHGDITHYLIPTSIGVFEHQVRVFGQYTIGVFEAVEQDLTQQRSATQLPPDESQDGKLVFDPEQHYKAPVIIFDDYIQRCEERMNFSIELELVTESQNDIPAISLDISLNGLRVKVSKDYEFLPGRKLFVLFRGLEREYSLGIKNGVLYSVLEIEKHTDYQRLSLERVNTGDTAPFDQFLEQFINGNKRRYKVNVDNTIHALRVKGYEQYYIPYFTSAPIFIADSEYGYEPKFLLTNNNNRETISYWHDEARWLKIEGLLTRKRLHRYLDDTTSAVSTTVYCFSFNHQQKTFFYSATIEELMEDRALMMTFFGYGSRRVSWRVYQLQLTPVDPAKAHKPLSLPDSVSEFVSKKNAPIAPRLVKKLHNVSHVALLTDITNKDNTEPFQTIKVGRDSVGAIQQFLHPRTPEHDPLELYRFKYHELRHEQRFNYRTDIVLSVDGKRVSATTEDISITGLRVQLNEECEINRRSIVLVSLPNLQQFIKKVPLVDLPYKVMNVSNNGQVIHLRGFTEFDEDDTKPMSTSRRFFGAFIKQFKDKLVSIAEPDDVPGTGEALRNIIAGSNTNLAVFFARSNIKIYPTAFGNPHEGSRLLTLFENTSGGSELNLAPLYKQGEETNDVISPLVKKLQNDNTPVMLEAFIKVPNDNKSDSVCRYSDQFTTHQERKAFVKDALANGQFYGLKLFISKAGKADIDVLQTELKYVNVYASHRATELENELWSVIAVGDILDTTEEVLARYGLLASSS